MKWIRMVVIIVLLAFVASSAADVIDPNTGGYHNMYYPQLAERCYRIENANEYPGYIIGVAPYPNQSDGFVSFDTKRCFLGNLDNVTRDSQIYAMRETDYYQLKRENPERITYRTAIPSGYPAPLPSKWYNFYDYAPQNETDVLSIVTLDNSRFILNTTRSYEIFSNGEKHELPVLEPTLMETTPISPIPVPSPESGTAVSTTVTSVPVPGDDRNTTDGNPYIYQYFLLPLLALGVIAALLIRRFKK